MEELFKKLISMEPIEIAGIAVPGLLLLVGGLYLAKVGPFKKRRNYTRRRRTKHVYR